MLRTKHLVSDGEGWGNTHKIKEKAINKFVLESSLGFRVFAPSKVTNFTVVVFYEHTKRVHGLIAHRNKTLDSGTRSVPSFDICVLFRLIQTAWKFAPQSESSSFRHSRDIVRSLFLWIKAHHLRNPRGAKRVNPFVFLSHNYFVGTTSMWA